MTKGTFFICELINVNCLERIHIHKIVEYNLLFGYFPDLLLMILPCQLQDVCRFAHFSP